MKQYLLLVFLLGCGGFGKESHRIETSHAVRNFHVVEFARTPLDGRVVISSADCPAPSTEEDMFYVHRNASIGCQSDYRVIDFLAYNDRKNISLTVECLK